MESLLRRLIDPGDAGPVLAAMLVGYYGGATLANDDFAGVSEQRLVAILALLSGVLIALGWCVNERHDVLWGSAVFGAPRCC